ncbi:MAG: hypothetical protein C0417_11825 [Chlorobiaceae bacterium]|nr:hypothetical protein [Chlorobiaceae bacterium]
MKKGIHIALLLIFVISHLIGQATQEERIPIELRVTGIGSIPLEVIALDTIIYFNSKTIFDFLGIYNTYFSERQTIEGFYKNKRTPYVIDCSVPEARMKKISVPLTSDDFLIRDMEVYLNKDFINKFFKLDLRYNKRRLLVEMPRVGDLPRVKYIEQLRRREHLAESAINLPPPEMTIDRSFYIIDGGRLTYNFYNRFTKSTSPHRNYNFNYGGGILGGDINLRYYGTQRKFRSFDQFRAKWRYPIFNQPYLRQIIVGDLVSSGFLASLVRGFGITNKPLQQRYFFGNEDVEGVFSPNIDVELKSTQSDYQFSRTDSSGKYYFSLPIYYGQGRSTIQTLDPWGFQEMEQFRSNLPVSMVPPGTVEYSVIAGKARYGLKRYTSTANLQWGVTSNLTIGSTLSYFDQPKMRSKIYPTINSIVRINSGMSFDLQVTPLAYSSAKLQCLLPSDVEIKANAIYYAENIYFNPARLKNKYDILTNIPFSAWGGFSVNLVQASLHTYRYRNADLSFYLTSRFISTRFLSRWSWRVNGEKNILLTRQSYFDISLNLPLGVFIMGEASYNHVRKELEIVGVSINKILFNSLHIGFSHNRLPIFGYNITSLRLEYVFPFVRAIAGASQNGPHMREYFAGATGTVNFSIRPFFMLPENRMTNLGFGGLKINPFFDTNSNGVLDDDEVETKEGKVLFSNVSRSSKVAAIPVTSNRLMRLPSYEEYDISLDPQSLENPMWTPTTGVVRVSAEPDRIKEINIPLVIGGTIRGMIKVQGTQMPAEGIKVILRAKRNSNGKKYTTTSFSTGEYEFSTIPPGKYRLELEDVQLTQLGYKFQPLGFDVEVRTSEEGDLISEKDFTLLPK